MSGASSLFGYMVQENSGSEFNRAMFQGRRLTAQMRQMTPVRIVKVYAADGKTAATRGAVAASGFVDVQPIVSQVDGKGQKQDHTTIYHIPFSRNYGGDAAIIMDPVVGDIGHIHPADRDISAFKDQVTQGGSTQTVLPGSQRRSSFSDSVFIGGTKNGTPKQYITFTDQGMTVVDKNGNKIECTSSGMKLTPAGGTVTIQGNLKATGSVVAGNGTGDQVTLQTHTHNAAGGSGDSGGPNAGT